MGYAVVNESELLEHVGGDLDLIHQLVDVFLEERPLLMAALNAALARRDASALEQAAHNLKSALSYFSSARVYTKAEQLEVMGRQGELAGAQRIYGELRDELRLLESALFALKVKVQHADSGS